MLGTIPDGINNNGVDTPIMLPGNLAINRNPRGGKPAFNTALFVSPADLIDHQRHGFDWHQIQIAAEEAARLAAILPAPLKRRPERMDNYSELILQRMRKMGW